MPPRRKTQPRKIPKQSRSRELVAAIVEAATRILSTKGYAGTNVNQVAELAGVSIGSLYQYFPSKEALVGAVADKLGADTAALVAERTAGLEHAAPREAIHAVVECLVAAYRLNPPLRRLIRDEVPEAVPHFATPDVDMHLRAAIVDYLQTHRAHLRPANLELAVTIIFKTAESVCEHTTAWPHDEVTGELTTMLERYLLRDDER